MENHIKTNSLDWNTGKVKGFSGKNLINLTNGGLKKVKVDAFASYPTHLHPDKTEFIYVLEGNPEISIGTEHAIGKQHDFFILPKDLKHSITNNSDKECILLVGNIKQ